MNAAVIYVLVTAAAVWFPSALQYSFWCKANLDEKCVGMNMHTHTYMYIVILLVCCCQHLLHENQGEGH